MPTMRLVPAQTAQCPIQMPADVSVINNPELKEKFETYWSVPGQSAIERMKF